MANANTPYGLQLVQGRGISDFRSAFEVFKVAANTTNAIYVGDPVIKLAASADVNGIDGINLATAGTNHAITGVVVGFLGTGTAVLGQPGAASFFGLSGTPGPAYKPANAAPVYYALVCTDPNAVYSIQSNDSGGNPAATNVGKNANLASGSGSQYTGWSGWLMAANQIATTSTYQVNIIGVDPVANNVAGSANCKFLVRINNSTEGLAATGI